MAYLGQRIKGQEKIHERLITALQKRSFPHALLFSGPSGVGKKKMAWALAQNLLCDKSLPACGECFSCKRVEKEESESVLFISPKTLQIKIDEVRGITGFLALQTSARAKIVIVDEADRLNLQAVNSLLKIVEEPPLKSFFFFISPSPSRLPVTLRSRLQTLRFKKLPVSVIRDLTSEEGWLISAAQGRMDVINQLKDKKELRTLSLELWKKIFVKDTLPFAMNFPLELKDRKQALFVSQSWQWLLRDGRMMKAGEKSGFIHGDQESLRGQIALMPTGALDFLIQQVLLMERNLRAYMDCILCFEHFALSLQQCL
ncbi:MAG: AAA family ATPase, partial [Bdellovibrionales bacterium]|nr:AAA family ATPase [Bdellovibrionales bacterium]